MPDGKYIEIGTTGKKEEAQAINTTTGVSDASKIVRTGADGYLDPSFLPASDQKIVEASEALSAGDFVNIWLDTGTPKVRKADSTAASQSKRADGFVLNGAASGEDVIVYFEGVNSQLSALTIGAIYFLAVTGGVTSVAPTGSGHSLQVVGRSLSATEIQFERSEPVTRV